MILKIDIHVGKTLWVRDTSVTTNKIVTGTDATNGILYKHNACAN